MTRFMIRVELHNASEAQYIRLHELMAARGLFRIIVGDDNKKYWLPPAEYTTLSELTRDQVRGIAKACAAAVVTRYAVVVAEATAVTWEGLQAA
jgi:hypothetical protein